MSTNIKILVFIIMVILVPNAYSQFNIGAIGGINNASLSVDEGEITSRWLWHAGLILEYQLDEHFSIQAEPMYLKKGGIQEPEINNPEFTLDQSFLEVPFFCKYSYGNEHKIFLLAGPSIGYTLSSEIEATLNGIIFKADMIDVTESIDFSFAFGAGFDINTNPGSVIIEAKYFMGLTNLAKNGQYTAKAGHLEIDQEFDSEESKYNSRGFQITLGFTLPF